MKLGKFIKAPGERKRYSIDYNNWLETGELVSTKTFVVSPTTTSPLIIDASAILTGSRSIAFYVQGGLDGETYKVVVTITTSGGQTKEDVVFFQVKDV